MSEDDFRQEAEIKRQRLRDQIKDQDDAGQRAMVRNWVIELMVDHGQLRESVEHFSNQTTAFQATVNTALFVGDPESGAPGIVPVTRRVATLLDTGCRIIKWALGLLVAIAPLIVYFK